MKTLQRMSGGDCRHRLVRRRSSGRGDLSFCGPGRRGLDGSTFVERVVATHHHRQRVRAAGRDAARSWSSFRFWQRRGSRSRRRYGVSTCGANVKWHDGTPFNADDVVFSHERSKVDGSDMKTKMGSIKEVKKDRRQSRSIS